MRINEDKKMVQPQRTIQSFLKGLRNLLGVGIYLVIIGIVLEFLTIVLQSYLSFSISLSIQWQITLTVLCIVFCLSGMIWFNKTLHLIRIHIAGGENELVTRGPFNFVRHPLYATLLMALPPLLIIWFENLLFVAPWVLMYVIAHYLIKIEERNLIRIFGEKYTKYREFVPQLIPWKGSGGTKYREYCANGKANGQSRSV